MPKDSKQDDYSINDDTVSDDSVSDENTPIEEEPELDNLSDDVKEVLGLDENGEEKIKTPIVRGKKIIKEAAPISDWLPADDANALEHIDSLY